jgi:Uma2 family endonuclease
LEPDEDMTILHQLNISDFHEENAAKRVTEAEYWEKYYEYSDVVCEWQDGYLEEKPVLDYLTILMYKWLLQLLEYYLMTYPIAKAVLLEMGFRLVLPYKINIRKPDLGVVLNDNPIPLLPEDNSYKGTFDLCVEALSNSSIQAIHRDTVKKKGEYAAAGVKEYYILYGHGEPMAFYRLNAAGVYELVLQPQSGLIQSEVLPGFQFRFADLFAQPTPQEMIADPIYQNFVLPNYRQEQLARQQAEQRAQ